MAIKEAVVRRIDNNDVILSLVIAPKCITCRQKCLLRGRVFKAKNKRKLPIKKGSVVTVGTDGFYEAIWGIISLVIPIFCAFLGYFLSGSGASETRKAVFVLLFLFASSIVVRIISRILFRTFKPEILEILTYQSQSL